MDLAHGFLGVGTKDHVSPLARTEYDYIHRLLVRDGVLRQHAVLQPNARWVMPAMVLLKLHSADI